jgi:hypothetical protein
MGMKKTVLAVALSLLLCACNSVKSEKLPASGDTAKLAEIGKGLSDDDKKLFAGYLMRREMAKAFGNTTLPDQATTVGEAITAQQKFADNLSESEKKAQALKLETEQKRKAVAEQISRTVTVAFIDAHLVPSNIDAGRFNSNESLTFAVQNSGAKAIKALKGQAVFIDTFGDEYVRVPMQFEQAVAPGARETVDLSYEINEFLDLDKKIMALDKEKRFRFEPEQIVFADGSTLRAPDAPSS